MKKFFLALAAIATPLLAEAPPVESPDLAPPPDLSSPVYATHDDAPIRDRSEQQDISNGKKAAVAIIGTVAAITIGLLVSGSNTGKHIPPTELRDKKAS